jgi:hypothetical protein
VCMYVCIHVNLSICMQSAVGKTSPGGGGPDGADDAHDCERERERVNERERVSV